MLYSHVSSLVQSRAQVPTCQLTVLALYPAVMFGLMLHATEVLLSVSFKGVLFLHFSLPVPYLHVCVCGEGAYKQEKHTTIISGQIS